MSEDRKLQEPEKNEEKLKKRHYVLAVLASVLIALGVVYVFFTFYFSGHFMFGTTVNGIKCSGKSVETAKNLITEEINSYVLVLEERSGDTEEVYGVDIYLAPMFDDTLEEELEKQKSFTWPLYLFQENEVHTDAMITYNEDDLRDVLENLACMDQNTQIAPVSASISEYTADGYSIIPAEYGNTIDEDAFMEAVEAAVLELDETLDMSEAGCYVEPEYTEQSEELIQAVETLNRYTGHTITYDFGDEKEVLDGSALSDWMVVSGDFQVSVNEELAAEYISELAKTYNTFGREKELETSYGVTVTVPGGNYGWKIDKEAELPELINAVKEEGDVEREPVYAQTAASRSGNDYGNTYVEINLSAQHLYFYKDGELVIETNFVSGEVADGNATPTGAYFVNSKETDRYLTGEDYKSYVNYWMPFNGGVGMHDATWRSSFGGATYLTAGSHGCINLSKSAAATIFENLTVGDAVLVYKLDSTSVISDSAAASMVIDKINSVGEVTLLSEVVIVAARNLYNNLTDSAKAMVSNYTLLCAQENQLAALKAQAAAAAAAPPAEISQ